MNIEDMTLTFSGEREFNELMESFIIPELKKHDTFIDAYVLPNPWSLGSLDDNNQKLTNAYYFYVNTEFEEYLALIFKDHNRWLVCKAERFYKSDFIPGDSYLKINDCHVFYPRYGSHSLLDIYENNPTRIKSILEDIIGETAAFNLMFRAQCKLLEIRHCKITSKATDNPYDPLKEALRFIVNNKNLFPSPDLNGIYLFNDLEFSNIEDLISYLAKEIHLKNLACKMKEKGLTQYDFMTKPSLEEISEILKDINDRNKGD